MDEGLIALLLSIATAGWTYVQQRWITKQKKATTKEMFPAKKVSK